MQRQLSNVSFHSYQEYQPNRRYGPQYEPGGYAAAVQQRSNMTQREDALKFEQGRIKALQEERLHIQKKTFTKWMNSFLQKVRMEVEDLFVDLADGRRLLKLLEIISGERLPRPNTGRMRVHKIENVNKSLSFLHTKVRLESIGAEDIVDGNPRLILGLIWTIILRFQIQEIEIDVDEENESSEKKSAKDALLLWCQRKTNGYHGVHIHNFSDSWRSGLGFNALIHAHRPDLFRWTEVPVSDPVETLNHAFEVAHKNLGIPKLLDAEDVDTQRPDEKSVMTYVASYYHTFARMKNEQKSGRRIANIIGQLVDCDGRKAEYSRLLTTLLEWIRMKITELNDRELPNSLDGIQRLLLAFKQYRTVEKPPKYKERSEIEALYFHINTMQKSLVGEAWTPLEGQLPQDLERAWQQLEQAEHAREIALRTELLRQQRLEQLNYKFNTKSVLRKGYLKEMIQVLSDPRYGSNLAQVDATVKKHEAISADILARTERFEDLTAMAAELVKENYHGAEAVEKTSAAVLERWRELLALLERHRSSLAQLARLCALLREADAVQQELQLMKSQFQSEEVGRHLSDVERLLQAHALQELQLGALDETIRRLVRQGNTAEGPAQPKKQLADQLTHLEDAYDSLVAAAKDRKARLEDARNLYQFLEDHDEEEGWVTEKQRICRTDMAAKDLRGVLALRQKHTALLHEMRARESVAQRHRSKGESLLDAKHPKSSEIERRLASLMAQWEVLRDLAAAREKKLADAAEAYQFYGDANEAESWMKEKRPLAGSSDCGGDAPSASALLARHRALIEEIQAYNTELETLRTHAKRLTDSGITQLQLPTEVESAPAEEEEWVKETRLVPTDVWEEQPVERLEHRTVTEQRAVPQVKALYAFSGQGISIQKGEVMFLISRSNPDWWSVRKADRSDGFVPANYVREIEPRMLPVQVRRPEKVKTVQRVKKTVLVKQVVPVRKVTTARRPSRADVTTRETLPVPVKMKQVDEMYAELLTLAAARRAQLEDAIKLYSLFAEVDDLDKWIRDKERMLRADDAGETVDSAKRKYEKFVTDLSAASKRLEHIDSATEELIKSGHSSAKTAAARRQQLKTRWGALLDLKLEKEKSLEGADSVELFGRTCDEALDWMLEKEAQLADSAAGSGGALRDVRALQRRHAQLERELEPLREKVTTVTLLADSVKSQYPNERANVEARQRQIEEMWQRCRRQASERRARLETAVGHQIFNNSSATLLDWVHKTRDQIAQEVTAKDVATAEAVYKQHQEILDDMKTRDDEFREVIALGEKLIANNPALTDVADKIKSLKEEHDAVEKEWRDKDEYLKQRVQLATFTREADHIDAGSRAHEACLDQTDQGSSVDEVSALVKRHEELEARLAAQEDRLAAFLQPPPETHYARDAILARQQSVASRREAARLAAASRRRALQASLAYHQFLEAAGELENWIQDKTKTATDQNYRDLTNLERKLQKHEAFERELQANEKQLRNVESVGQSLAQSDPGRAKPVTSRLQALQASWAKLVAASRDKGSKLRQAHSARAHKRAVEDASARLAELERALKSKETGADLRSCKRLINQHQALEQELASLEQKASALTLAGQDLASGGHFDAASIQQCSAQLAAAATALRRPAEERRQALNTCMQFHKFAAEMSNELAWLDERKAAATSMSLPGELLAAQSAAKRHAKLRAELKAKDPGLKRVLQAGQELAKENSVYSDQIKALSTQLEQEYDQVCRAADERAGHLEAALKAQQLFHEALELDGWLADKAAALQEPDSGRDRHRATALLARHKAVELELDTYAAIISEMRHVASAMQAAGNPAGPALVERGGQLAEHLGRLQRAAAQRQGDLLESVCRHEYLAESAELEEWIQEQFTAASSEDYGQDYEHLLLLRSKFEELRMRVESGAERFAQCEELAKKLLASRSRHIPDIERRQGALGESWQRLVEQIQTRASRLHAAGEIHRFHRDVAELISRAADKRAQLSTYTDGVPRARDNLDNDLVAIEAQMQVLQEEGQRLQRLYPGENEQQISRQQRALVAAAEALRSAAKARKLHVARKAQTAALLGQIRDLMSWSAAARAAMSASTSGADTAAGAGQAQAARAEHDALRAEIEAREPGFREALEKGAEMVKAGHPDSQEISERCNALAEERAKLGAAWAARQVALDQLIDLRCFLRDAGQLNDLCAAQEAALGTEISATLSVEEVQNQLKKHEAFEKLLVTQDERLSTLNSHGDKLLQQSHVESQRIARELQALNQRRKKVHVLSAARRGLLRRALARAQFARDVAEARAWVAGKLTHLLADQKHGEVANLEEKIKMLQKHQAFKAELAANETRMQEIASLAEQLGSERDVQEALAALRSEWQKLAEATEMRGRGLEEAQDILEFNQHLDKVEAWLRDKEMMVQAHELGRDYEHCSALLRKLDDLDSDMQVDEAQARAVSVLADKLLQQGPTAQAAAAAARRDAFAAKWRALTGALQEYRDHLTTALDIHAFNRDVEDTKERISSKSALFASKSRGRDLAAAHELRRRHQALSSEASAVGDKLAELRARGGQLAHDYPERASEIDSSLKELGERWEKLQKLQKERSDFLDDALAVHKFDESLKELELWVSESVKRMGIAAPAEAAAERPTDLEAELQAHREIKAEIDGRQKSIEALRKQAEVELAGSEDLPEKLERLGKLADTLDRAWNERKTYLTEAHQLVQLEERARAVEDWLASREAFLNNEDLGDNLDAVETLIRKHSEFTKLMESQAGRVAELEQFAATLLNAGHSSSDLIKKRLADARARAEKLKESSASRGRTLQQSLQLQQFLQNLAHEREWIGLKMQVASDQNYRELSNLQSKIQKHAAFESELAANKGRLEDVSSAGQKLISDGHYAEKEIAAHLEEMEDMWAELQSTAKLRRQRLQEAYQARVFLRGLEEFTAWLDEAEGQLCSEDLGKDLQSVNALLKRHSRLEAAAASQADGAAPLADTARQLAAAGHFMAEELLARADEAVQRYNQLQEPLQIRRENLEDAKLLHQWNNDADEEMSWLKEREPTITMQDEGSTLAQAQALLKKHLAVEAELIAREPTLVSLETQALQLSRRGHFAGSELAARAAALRAAGRALRDRATARQRRLAQNMAALQLLSELTEAVAWLSERGASLASPEHGRDEPGALRLMKRLTAERREIENFDATVDRLEKAALAIDTENPTPIEEQIKAKATELRSLREDLKLLAAKREQRLQQSLKYFKFVQECEETQEWIGSQLARAASEEYGVDAEHVDSLQQTFDYFLQQMHANEGRIEAVIEAGTTLLEENSPESERVRQRMEDTKGLWEDLKELAAARQEALAGARQVHEFDRTADETVSWIQEKRSVLAAGRAAPPHALRADLAAIAARARQLEGQRDKLSEAFPDAKEHVTCKHEDVRSALAELRAAAETAEQQCALATQLQAYFAAHQDLLAWCLETLARVTAPDLAPDVAGAERLVARHRDVKVEIDAKGDEFQQLYSDGEKLVNEGHFMSEEIEERMSTLRARKSQLDDTWSRRANIYDEHLDALVFRRDADALDSWIDSRVPLVRDGKLGDSVPQVEELINRHRDLEQTIHSQRERFEALKRITLVEKAFQMQKDAEAGARREAAERREQERLEVLRKREVQRIAEERRREQHRDQVETSGTQQAEAEETLSPAPQFEKLPKADSAVKRAESMQVVKTPKRTPSFTTRRRTQSFRRHQRPDAGLPPVEIEGMLERKQEAGAGGARATSRSWRAHYTVLCGQLLAFFRDPADWAAARAAAPPAPLLNARCAPAEDYTKRSHVFRLACADGAEYLFACPSRDVMMDWIAKITFHAQLPPELQLTPYADSAQTTDELKKRLHQNASSSSSETSPEPRRQLAGRSQTEILHQHRAAQLTQQTQQSRNIESAVLPSLPPRQAEADDGFTDVITRNSEQNTAAWGRSRFSNGRDMNTEFIRSQQEASDGAPPLPPTAPPATERPPTLPERNANIPERGPTIPERSTNVSSLVNSYQRMTRTDNGRPYEKERQNNNWQNVETSHFYAANEFAYGGGSGGGTRPASVAGSGGSPALDREARPASRSSGESELSVSGVPKDKKDKKGVFGGLFSRKKRPQSHM